MRKTSLLLFILLSNLGLVSQDLERIEIDVRKAVKPIYFSEVFDDYKIVTLETTKKSYLGEIRKLGVWKGSIYLLDPFEGKSVTVFDKSGTFKYQLGKQGHGPGEYSMPRDICRTQHSIALIDNATSIIHYDFNGNYIREDKFNDLTATRIIDLPRNEYAVISGNWYDHLNIVSDRLKVMNSHFPFTERVYKADIYDPLQKDGNGNVICRCNLIDTIYRITDRQPIPHYYVDFGTYQIPQNVISLYSKSMVTLSEKCASYCQLSRFYELSDQILLSFRYQNQNYFGLYDKTTKRTSVVKQLDLLNDITQCKYRLLGKDLESNRFVFILQPFDILEDLESKLLKTKNSQARKALEELSKNLEDSSNPVLLFARMRSF